MNELPPEIRKDFTASMQPRFDELSREHTVRTTPRAENLDRFAREIGGPATAEAIERTNGTEPTSHSDREW